MTNKYKYKTRKRASLAILIVSISLNANYGCIKNPWRLIMSDEKIADKLEFDFKIIGTPILLKDSKGYASLAFIRGYEVDEDRFIQPDAYWLNGKRVTDAFPLSYGEKYFVTYPKRNEGSFDEKYKGKYFIIYPNQLAAGDVNKDGTDELIAIDGSNFLWGIDHSGKILNGYPVSIGKPRDFMPNWPPALKDFNNDGELEILYLAADNFLELRRLDGTSLPNFPVNLMAEVSDQGPVIISDKVFILYPFEQRIDGINITSGQRISNYPKSLEAYGNKSPYQRICAFESMSGIITSSEMPYLAYLNYKTGEQKKIEIKGASRITGLATMKSYETSGEIEYLLAYDEDNNKLFKINNKGELRDTYDIKLDKKYSNIHLSTQYDAEKKESYIFLISYIAPMVDIDEIFKEYGTPEEEKQISSRLYNNILKANNVTELTGKLLDYYNERLKVYKEDHLIIKLGEDEYLKHKYPSPVIDIIIIKDSSEKEPIFEEKFQSYEFKTILPSLGGQSATIRPLFYVHNSKRYIIVAMNLIRKVGSEKDKSIIRIINY